jgi:hypothetical protein
LVGITRSTVGVEVPESGVEATDTSDSLRLRVLKIVGCVWGRWKTAAGRWTGAEFHEPSRYRLIAVWS